MVTYLANRFDVQCLKINVVCSLCKFVRLKIQIVIHHRLPAKNTTLTIH